MGLIQNCGAHPAGKYQETIAYLGRNVNNRCWIVVEQAFCFTLFNVYVVIYSALFALLDRGGEIELKIEDKLAKFSKVCYYNYSHVTLTHRDGV